MIEPPSPPNFERDEKFPLKKNKTHIHARSRSTKYEVKLIIICKFMRSSPLIHQAIAIATRLIIHRELRDHETHTFYGQASDSLYGSGEGSWGRGGGVGLIVFSTYYLLVEQEPPKKWSL